MKERQGSRFGETERGEKRMTSVTSQTIHPLRENQTHKHFLNLWLSSLLIGPKTRGEEQKKI